VRHAGGLDTAVRSFLPLPAAGPTRQAEPDRSAEADVGAPRTESDPLGGNFRIPVENH
jgi:hypothetical protein